MPEQPQRIRVFISSPGDVAEERVLANKLVRRLADEYAGRAWVEPVLWEHEPLLASDTFQSQIPRPSESEVVVCILWSRLGTRLPPDLTRPDGSRYASGTEYEFEDAVAGRARNGTPDLLVYRKTATPLVDLNDEPQLMRRLDQKRALDQFVQRWFVNESDGSLKAAFHAFETPDEFEAALEEHLRKLIARRLPPGSERAGRPGPAWTAGSPYRGIEPFGYEHAAVFFGRGRAVGDVLNALRRNAADGRAFVLIAGLSGGGKSSLVAAGVLPVLTQPGVVEGVGHWRRATMRPGDTGDVFLSLARSVFAAEALPGLAADGTTPEQLACALRDNPSAGALMVKAGLARAAFEAAGPPPQGPPETRLALVVDQLEELFTFPALGVRDRDRFAAAVSALARSGKVWVVATLRGDFYHRSLEVPDLAGLQAGQGLYSLLPPTAAEIGQAIRQPARAAGLAFEEDPLTRATLDDVLRDAASVNPECLPLLEFALDELYHRRAPDGLLTYAAYREMGGVEGALARRAEQTFADLPADARPVLSQVFRKLIAVSDAGLPVRRKSATDDVADTPAARAFVHAFITARLFTADTGDGGSGVVQLSHEALIRQWPRLTSWLEENRELLQVRTRVAAAAVRWAAEGRRGDLLLPAGKPLEEALMLLHGTGQGLLKVDEQRFVAASSGRAKRRVRAKRAAAVVLVLATVAAGLAAAYADRQRRLAAAGQAEARRQGHTAEVQRERAEQRGREAESRAAEAILAQADALLAGGRPDQARPLYAEARRRLAAMGGATVAADAGLLRAAAASPRELLSFSDQKARVFHVAASPDGKTGLSGGANGEIVVWDLLAARAITRLKGHTQSVTSVNFSPDGRQALSGARDGTIRIWDIADGREVAVIRPDAGPVTAVSLTPDGLLGVSGHEGGRIEVWDVTTRAGVRTLTGQAGTVPRVVVCPDGRRVVWAGSNSTINVWDLQLGRSVKSFTGERGPIQGLAVSPDGRWILSAGFNEPLKLWDIDGGGQPARTFPGHQGSVLAVAFSPDGKVAASTGMDTTIRLWDVASGKPLVTLNGHTGVVHSLAFVGGGRLLLSGGRDETVRVWDTRDPAVAGAFPVRSPVVHGAALSADGRLAATAEDDGIHLWDVATKREVAVRTSATGRRSVALSPDGSRLLVGGADGTVDVVNVADGKQLMSAKNHSKAVTWVGFAPPDGRLALSAALDGTVTLWDLDQGTAARTLAVRGATGPEKMLTDAAWSPDGRTVVTGGMDWRVRVWDVATGRERSVLSGHRDIVTAVALSPDGRTALSGGMDYALRLWDLAAGKEVWTTHAHHGTVDGVAFSPDGQTVAAAGGGELKLFRASDGLEICTFAEPTKGHHLAFGPDGRTIFCGGGGVGNGVRMWDLGRVEQEEALGLRVADARKEMQRDPGHPASRATLGEWYAFHGVDDRAVEMLEAARSAGAPVSSRLLARCYWRAENSRAAAAEFRKAVGEATDAADRRLLALCLAAVTPPLGASKPPATTTSPSVAVADALPDRPTAFWVIVGGQDKPGRRHWVRVGDDGWEERYDDGTLTRFEPAGVLVKDGHTRQLLRRVPDALRRGDFQVLVPPPVEGAFLEFRYGDGPWRQLSRVRFLE